MGTSETSDGEAITNSKLENKNILHTEVLEEAVQLGQLHAGAGAREAGHFNHIANNVVTNISFLHFVSILSNFSITFNY